MSNDPSPNEWLHEKITYVCKEFDIFSKKTAQSEVEGIKKIATNAVLLGFLRRFIEYLDECVYADVPPRTKVSLKRIEEEVYDSVSFSSAVKKVTIIKLTKEQPS